MTSPSRGGMSFRMWVMVSLIVFSSVSAWGEEDEDEGEGGWGGGGEGDDEGEGRRMLTAVASETSVKPAEAYSSVSFMNDDSLLSVMEMPELYMVHVKVPGFTSKDAVNVKFESGALVIDGKMERVASDCVVGRRLAMVLRCPPKVSSSFAHSVKLPFTSADGLTSHIDAGVITVSIPKQGNERRA